MTAGTPLTRDEVIKVAGEVDESIAAGLVRMGATAEELAEARAWVDWLGLSSHEP
jgi:hypothetical protein